MSSVNGRKPRVSIGLPVYNGERFIEESLNSLLEQTYTDFELIISDNASTDCTEEICRRYAAKDPRVHYYRNEHNLGVGYNFNRVFRLSRGEYFKWASADDLCKPELLERCLEVLNHDHSAVLAYAKTRFVDENGQILNISDPGWDLQSEDPHERLLYVIRAGHWVNPHYGVIRSEALSKTRLLPTYPGGDYRLLAELSLKGKFVEVPESLFLRRVHPGASSQNTTKVKWVMEFHTGNSARVSLPFWALFVDYLRLIMKCQLKPRQKLFLLSSVVRRMWWAHNRLVQEIITGLCSYGMQLGVGNNSNGTRYQVNGNRRRNCRQEATVLNLRANETVEVRSKEEILATLDESGRLDGLPFMPEMLKYCGKRLKVSNRADKTCDTIEKTGCRRMTNTVHLVDTRCDGAAHGGCEARCLLFWKEVWLRRPKERDSRMPAEQPERAALTEEALIPATRVTPDLSAGGGQEVFCCQATELRNASRYLCKWDYRHYVRDIISRNRTVREVIRAIFLEVFGELLRFKGYRLLLWIFNNVQRIRKRGPYPYMQGSLRRTPAAILNLKAGELVKVRSHEEILCSLDTNNKNRGLFFDVEMVKYCGGTYMVSGKVRRIINEKTGMMMQLPNDCVILDGVTCSGDYHQLCPRKIFPYWREVWLRRIDESS